MEADYYVSPSSRLPNRTSLKLVTGPAVEPFEVDAVADHLNLFSRALFPYVGGLIVAARQHCETYTRRQFVSATWRQKMDRFPVLCSTEPFAEIKLDVAPVRSVTAIGYVDATGATITLDPSLYQVDTDSEPTLVVPAFGFYWPAVRWQSKPVAVTFVAGYGADGSSSADSAAAIPETIKHAMKLLIAHWFVNREAVVLGGTGMSLPHGVQSLLDSECWGSYP